VVDKKRTQCLCPNVGDHCDPRPAVSLRGEVLHRNYHQHLAGGTPAALAWLGPAKERLVDLDVPGQQFPPWPHHGRPIAVQHSPSRLVRSQAKHPLEPECRDAVFLRGQVPGRSEPDGQRRPRVLEDRACRPGHPPTTGRTSTHRSGHLPTDTAAAVRADESTRPPQPIQVVKAGCIIGEPGAQVGVGPRVVQICPRHLVIVPAGRSNG
jgi:hypothetical protein